MIRTNGTFTTYGELWFDEEPRAPLPDILVFRQRFAPGLNVAAERFVSLANDLRLSRDDLWQQMEKSNRYEIRRAETKDRLACAMRVNPSREQIDAFAKFYDIFAAQKHLGRASQNWLIAAAEAGQLCLSTAIQDAHVLVRHAYVTSGVTARLFQSATHFPEDIANASQLVGRANRLLHWHDMTEFQRLGFETYDWGGITPRPRSASLCNINSFKKTFGGSERVYYNWSRPASALGRIYMPLRLWWNAKRPD